MLNIPSKKAANGLQFLSPLKQKQQAEAAVQKKLEELNKLHAALSSSDPLSSRWWWTFKHPITRMVTCSFVMLTNLYVYYGDPASFSNSKSYSTLLGDIYHGWFQPDEPGWFLLRWLVMIALAALGTWCGLRIQQRVLRDRFHLALFGYDDGLRPDRDPLAYQDGAFFVVGACVSFVWFIGLKVYGSMLWYSGAAEKHIPDSGMYAWTYASYNLALSGLLTFTADWWNLASVTDQMLQAISQNEAGKESVGYLAFANKDGERGKEATPSSPPQPPPEVGCVGRFARAVDLKVRGGLTRVAGWWVATPELSTAARRVVVTRAFLVVGWVPVSICMVVAYRRDRDIINGDAGAATGEQPTVGAQWAWSAEWNTEFMRMLAGSLVAFGNLCIIAQDWDFPAFSDSGDIKIAAVDFSNFTVSLPRWFQNVVVARFPHIATDIYISAKWFSYFGIMMGVAFDWAYWFMTALCFRPCDYAQLWDPGSGAIFSMSDAHLQEEYAGAASAEQCAWFTANPLLANWHNASSAARPVGDGDGGVRVVRVETGVFTGAYTIDEEDAYVWSGAPAIKMWLMCIPPLVGWVGVAWIIFTHEKVTCFNFRDVLAWHAEHGDEIDQEALGEAGVKGEEGEGGGEGRAHLNLAFLAKSQRSIAAARRLGAWMHEKEAVVANAVREHHRSHKGARAFKAQLKKPQETAKVGPLDGSSADPSPSLAPPEAKRAGELPPLSALPEAKEEARPDEARPQENKSEMEGLADQNVTTRRGPRK